MFTLDQIVAAFLLGALAVVLGFLAWYHWPRPKDLYVRKNWKPVKR